MRSWWNGRNTLPSTNASTESSSTHRFDRAAMPLPAAVTRGSVTPDAATSEFPSNFPVTRHFPETSPPFSLAPESIGVETWAACKAAIPARPKAPSTRFRLDQSDWIPQPHSSAVLRLGQELWDAAAAGSSSAENDPLRSSMGAEVAPLRPAWEVDQLRWPSSSDQLLAERSEVLDRMLSALRARQADLKVVAVSSLRPDDDRSTVASGLARHIAAGGQRVTLIDADSRVPSLATRCGIALAFGWRNVGPQDLNESLIRETSTGLFFVPQGDERRQDRVGGSPPLAVLIDRLRPHQDWIIVESGTISELFSLAPAHPPRLDAAVIVRHSTDTTTDEIDAARRRLGGLGIRYLAVADLFGHRRAAG